MSDEKNVPPNRPPTPEEKEARAESLEEAAQANRRDTPARCAVCGWPLADKPEDGCTRGNCSMRPRPQEPVDRIIVNVTTGMLPIVVWQCPGCQAKLQGHDPKMIQHLVAGGQVAVGCKACGAHLMLRIPRVVEAKPQLITPNTMGPNRKARRGLVKVNGGKR
jgi:hypothetical protein